VSEYLAGLPCVAPEAGGSYHLRAGLTADIFQAFAIYGFPFVKGIIRETHEIIVWYGSGAYSPAARVIHELDIVWQITY
jgi:hypothetical protein